MLSVDDRKDIVVDVVASGSVGADVEDLCESELISAVHLEVAVHEDEHAAGNGSFLHVWAHIRIGNLLEAEWLYFLADVLESAVRHASVGHVAVVVIEVDEDLSFVPALLHNGKVLLQEEVGDLLVVHKSQTNYYKLKRVS